MQTPHAEIEGPERNEDGFLTFTARSPYQSGATTVELILPGEIQEGRTYPVLYILPVTVGTRGKFGDGILEAERHEIAERHQVVCVSPSFSAVPWYADHPEDKTLRHETHFLEVVVPLIEERYPVGRRREDRLLVGFSKSGVGAFSLLLRHLETFGFAAAWDAPLTQPDPEQWEMKTIYATAENYRRYFVPDLIEAAARELKGQEARLILTGYGSFREHMQAVHEQLDALGVQHLYANDQLRTHDWHSGWFSEAVEALMDLRGRWMNA